ncbi:MAG: hypothetical protein M1839_009107 [Geoglossum umbratile]|nr:MAG: hypothetical protein M1839_009107 [Geoglossum umbratile]
MASSTTATAESGALSVASRRLSGSDGGWGRRPEIEEKERFEEVFKGEEGRFEKRSCVDYFEVGGRARRVWERGLDDEGLMELLERGDKEGSVEGVRVRAFFLKRSPDTPYIQKRLRITSGLMHDICSRFQISKTFVESLFDKQIWSGNGCFTQRNTEGRITRLELFYRGNSWWRDRTQVYVLHDFDERSITYLTVNCSETAIKRIRERDVVLRPFALDALLADEALKAWQDAINHYRGRLIHYEYRDVDTDDKHALATATNELHGLTTNLHRVTEHLADFRERMEFLRDALKTYYMVVGQNRERWRLGGGGDEGLDVDESLKFLIDGAKMGRRWAVNYLARATSLINLMFHHCSQTDNKIFAALTSTSVEITRLTSTLGEEAQRDNSAVVTLSVLAMLFLPGTFVAVGQKALKVPYLSPLTLDKTQGIFGMSFFSYTPASNGTTMTKESFSLSNKWWLYFAVTIPLTLAVFGVWDAWRRRRLRLRARNKNRDVK